MQVHGKVSKEVGYRKCNFVVPPETAYYWDDESCQMGGVGCWADGIHAECRFCDYDGVPCPEGAWRPGQHTCDFETEPVGVGYYWESSCPSIDGGLGCLADGKHQGCRFCGGDGNYSSIRCAVKQCTFANEPANPYYFDKECYNGMLGCLADGIHAGCRFCGRRPYENIPCPDSVQIPADACWFRNEPKVKHYWEPNCTMGKLGCWADGIHAECKFCGDAEGEFEACPSHIR